MKHALTVLFLLSIITFSFSDVYVTNSSNWKLAYIVGYYATLSGNKFFAIDSEATAEELAPYLLPKNEKIVIFEDGSKIYENMEGFLRARGFKNVETKTTSEYEIMFTFPKKTSSVVVVNDSSGEWALMAGPFAFSKGAAILLLNNKTMDKIVNYIKSNNISDITVIGYAGKRLRELLPNAKYINTGNKGKDSVEVAKLMGERSQVFVMSGMFLYLPGNPNNPEDAPLWTGGKGKYPILISYVNSMEKDVEKYLLSPHIRSIVFYGAELDKMWARIRELVDGEKVVVEQFAVGYANVPTREPGKQYPMLALFLPAADINVFTTNVKMFSSGKVVIGIKNSGKAGCYALPVLVEAQCGDLSIKHTGKEPLFIEGKAETVYEFQTQALPSEKCRVYVKLFYGPNADRMEEKFEKNYTVVPEPIKDASKIVVEKIVYSQRLERVIVYLKNESSVDSYAIVKVHLLVDGIPKDIMKGPVLVEKGQSKKIFLKSFLTEADIADNETVRVTILFGKDKTLPVHRETFELPLEKESLLDIALETAAENWLIIVIVIAFFAVLLLLKR